MYGQDTLPKFTVTQRGSRIVISWINPFKNISQLNIQRSTDSLRNFVTIWSPGSPEASPNGFTDATAPEGRVFYRIFYVLEGGDFAFTTSRRPVPATVAAAYQPKDVVSARDNVTSKLTNIDPSDTRLVTIKIKDSVFRQLPGNYFRLFRDSILRQTKDTLFAVNDSLVSIRPFVAKEIWRPSNYIYVNKDGYISISLPRVEERRYNVKFFEENGSSLFEVRHVKESPLVLDKSIFIHSGWFLFELYEDGKIKEKNKFYLPKDF